MDSAKFTNRNQRKNDDNRLTLGEQNVGASGKPHAETRSREEMEGGNGATIGSGITHSPERRTKCWRSLKPHAEPRRRGGCSRSFKNFFVSFAFFAA